MTPRNSTDQSNESVALKTIKAGMDTKEVIARFEAERQALALMGHPHVARAEFLLVTNLRIDLAGTQKHDLRLYLHTEFD